MAGIQRGFRTIDIKRLWQWTRGVFGSRNSSCVQTSANSPNASGALEFNGLAVVYYDGNLNISTREQALYELRFYDAPTLEWRLLTRTRDDTARFSIGSYALEWGPEEWSNFPRNIVSGLIKDLAQDPNSQCGFAFRWINSDWKQRYPLFLSTHCGTLDECEQVFTWLAHIFSPDNQNGMQASWSIVVSQSDNEALDPLLWSHVKRDCTFTSATTPLEFSDEQLKLVRLVHCYFMPFYREDARRQHQRVALWEKDAIWRFEIPSVSYHERLEARLRLRDWLSDKVAPAELDSVLLF